MIVLFVFFSVTAVHKNRDVIPLNINDDVEESDEDAEQPVLDFEVELLINFVRLVSDLYFLKFYLFDFPSLISRHCSF